MEIIKLMHSVQKRNYETSKHVRLHNFIIIHHHYTNNPVSQEGVILFVSKKKGGNMKFTNNTRSNVNHQRVHSYGTYIHPQ